MFFGPGLFIGPDSRSLYHNKSWGKEQSPIVICQQIGAAGRENFFIFHGFFLKKLEILERLVYNPL